MRGHVRRRGRESWEIKYDAGRDPKTGKRLTRYASIKGKRADAEKELTRLLQAADKGMAVNPSKVTLAEYLRTWIDDAAATRLSPKTAERYRELIAKQIIPHLGETRLQQLKPAQIATWHATLLRSGRHRGGALSARTVRHAHMVLHSALERAAETEIVARNVTSVVAPPKVESAEIEALTADQMVEVIAKIEGAGIYHIAVLALASGMRRGEILALRWADLDLDAGKVRVERSLEQTGAGLRFKSPKTRAGRRSITLPAHAVTALRDYRRQQLEQRLALGAGKLPADALVFGQLDGSPRSPRALSKQWEAAVKTYKLPDVTFHALRHSHASALIAAGVDPLTVSRRLGHGSAAITLNTYSHLFSNTDDKAADAINAAMSAKPRGDKR